MWHNCAAAIANVIYLHNCFSIILLSKHFIYIYFMYLFVRLFFFFKCLIVTKFAFRLPDSHTATNGLHNHVCNTVWRSHWEGSIIRQSISNHQALTMTMRLVHKCHLSLSLSVCLLPTLLVFSLCLIHAPTHTERQNIFISPLYAGCAQPEIAGLTPRCELYSGNVYPNPIEHTINLFLGRRQTRMSLHEGDKDRNQDHHDNHLIMKLREAVTSQGAQSLRDSLTAVYRCA